MKSNGERKNLISIFLIAVILFSFLSVSCHEVTELKRPDTLIPEKTMVAILTETTLADGLLTIPEVRDQFTNKDSLSVYARIVKRYGYTWEDMNNTMNFYFVKKQGKMLKIYDKVLARITEIQERINNEPIADAVSESDLWKGPRTIYFPDMLNPNDAGFSIRVNGPGYFTISYTMTLYPADQSLNPCYNLWYVNADSINTGKRKFIDSQKYFPDGDTRAYSISGKIENTALVVIEGKLFDRENLSDEGDKHARTEKVIFIFTRQAL